MAGGQRGEDDRRQTVLAEIRLRLSDLKAWYGIEDGAGLVIGEVVE